MGCGFRHIVQAGRIGHPGRMDPPDQRQTPGRVFKGKRMAGHMGVQRRTDENLRVLAVDVERNLLVVSGSVPGAEGGSVVVRPSVKMAARARRKYVAPTKK